MRISRPAVQSRSSSILKRGLPIIAAAALMLAPVVAHAEEAAAGGTVTSYTEDQAKRGKSAYNENCSGCHGTTMGGSGETPTVVGKGFRERWFIGSPEPIFDYISSNMPQGAGGSLPPEFLCRHRRLSDVQEPGSRR